MSALPTNPAIIGTPSTGADTSRLKNAKNLAAAGQQFEAIFTGMMLKAMRSTHLGEGLFESKASETFRDMQDQKTAEAMATHAPLGIGKAMTEFLSRSQTDLAPETAPATPQADINQDRAS